MQPEGNCGVVRLGDATNAIALDAARMHNASTE
jgi:hypothetical protein